jgi:hypothetical protein
MNGAVITTIEGIIPLPKVEAVETMVVWNDEGGLGGGTPPIVAVVEGV